MKKLRLIMLILIVIVNVGCGTGKNTPPASNFNKTVDSSVNKVVQSATNTGNSDYAITKAEYEDKGIKISYPQISNSNDSDKQSKINEVIKLDALKVLNNYKDDIDKLDLKMDYEIKYKGSNVLSIQYLGLANVKNSVYPVNLCNTTNIDLIKGSRLTLKEVAAINSSFVEKYKTGKYKPYSTDLNLESAEVLKPVLEDIVKGDLNQQLQKAETNFYFSKDSLGISMEVPHAVGDHMEMEINYKDLEGLLLLTPKDYNEVSRDKVSTTEKSVTPAPKATQKPAAVSDSVPSKKAETKPAVSSTKDKGDLFPELLKAICLSEVLHYDSFTNEPDEITTAFALQNLVSKKHFSWSDILKIDNGAYYFSFGPESEDADKTEGKYISPDMLYSDFFANGKFKYPPAELSSLIEGTQTGVAIHIKDLPYEGTGLAKDIGDKDGIMDISATISRTYKDGKKPDVLGDAIITFKEAKGTCYFDYKIVGFEPKYAKFEDIKLK